MEYALKLQRVSKIYASRQARTVVVRKLDLAVKQGAVFGFLGPNGAGKTTAMKMMVGLAQPSSGTIRIFDHVAGSLEAAQAIGYLPENPTLYRYTSAFEFVVMHARLTGLSKREAVAQADKLLDLVGLGQAKHQRIKEYSKGMVQRTGLAQALAGNPQILFLDEPFDGLDVLGRFEMKRLIAMLQKQQKTIFFNSHILSDVEELCDHVGIIDHGTLLEHGTVKSLLKKGQTLEQYFVKRIEKERV